MAKKFKAFVERDKPRKRPGRHKKRLNKNYKVIGLERRSARSNNWRLEKLNIKNKVIIEDIDIKEFNNLIRIFDKYKVDEVYNLAAQSFVQSSFQNPIETSLVNSIGVLNLLEIIRNKKNKIKIIINCKKYLILSIYFFF